MPSALAKGYTGRILMAGEFSYRCEVVFVIYPENRSNLCTKGYGLSLNAGRWLRTVCRAINANARFLRLAGVRACIGVNFWRLGRSPSGAKSYLNANRLNQYLGANLRVSVKRIGSHGEQAAPLFKANPLPLVLGNFESRGGQCLNEGFLRVARHSEERSIVVACLNV